MVAAHLGLLVKEPWKVMIDYAHLPSGGVIREGDRLKKTDTGETFTVVQAKLVGADRRYAWNLIADRKTA